MWAAITLVSEERLRSFLEHWEPPPELLDQPQPRTVPDLLGGGSKIVMTRLKEKAPHTPAATDPDLSALGERLALAPWTMDDLAQLGALLGVFRTDEGLRSAFEEVAACQWSTRDVRATPFPVQLVRSLASVRDLESTAATWSAYIGDGLDRSKSLDSLVRSAAQAEKLGKRLVLIEGS